MPEWKATPHVKKLPKLDAPILVEGLPGIGNVGKVAVDFLIEELQAKKLYTLFSYTLPHSVFVNEKNLVELPAIDIFYKQRKGKPDLLFLTGDVQPIDEVSSYQFSEKVLEILASFGGVEVITTGGIGLQEIPDKPEVFITGNDEKEVKSFARGIKVKTKIHGVVGPIVGTTGLLIGLAKQYDIKGIALLVETFGHPLYLGVKGAQELLKILDKKLALKVDLAKLTDEIIKLEQETMKKTKDLPSFAKRMGGKGETSYIG